MITSLLDNDLYQFTMSACLWQQGWADLRVRYEFRNRTFGVPLASRLSLNQLAAEITRIQELRFTPENIAFLAGMKIFPQGWLDWLPEARLPDVQIGNDSGHLRLQYEGNVCEAIFWETLLLALVDEMYFSRFGDFLSEGRQRLQEKIDYLRERGTLKFVEFGTRRRFSKDWQHYVIHEIKQEIPNLLLGTSNVALAQEFDIPAIGTMAHQMFMVMTALELERLGGDRVQDAVADGTNAVLKMWFDTYRDHPFLMTVLPDTYGTKNFIRLADPDLVRFFGTCRQDSGDPLQIGDLWQLYARTMLGQSYPKIVFSDGLDIRSMSVIEDHFKGRVESPSGWGTNLTNDLGYEPLSLVIKPSGVLYHDQKTWLPCVKVSDDVRKATGTPEAVRQYIDQLF